MLARLSQYNVEAKGRTKTIALTPPQPVAQGRQ